MIGIDWGTTSFRAFRLAADGTIRDRKVSQRGIMAVPDSRFGDTLREEVGPWLAAGERHVLLSGMIGSRQGWVEAPYLPLPAGAAELAAALIDIPFDWGRVKLMPGLTGTDIAGVAEVMRGEETQLLGIAALDHRDGRACLPGTHSKWARVAAGRVSGFTTHMTGETFAALKGHTILGRMMRDGPIDPQAFAAGVRRSANPGGLLHHIFGARSEALAGRLEEAATGSYLSGILIGHEMRSELTEETVHLVGSAELTALYAEAIAICGGRSERHPDDAAAHGLARVGRLAHWD